MKEEIEYGYVFLSDEEAALKLGMHVKTYKKHLNSLIEKGYIDIVEIDGKSVKRFKLNGHVKNKNFES